MYHLFLNLYFVLFCLDHTVNLYFNLTLLFQDFDQSSNSMDVFKPVLLHLENEVANKIFKTVNEF